MRGVPATVTRGLRDRHWLGLALGVVVFLAALSLALLHWLVGAALLALACGGLVSLSARRDPVSLLTVFVILLCGLSARLVVGPLGAVGTPAALVAYVGLGWWTVSRVLPALGSASGRQPMRVALLAFVGVMLLGYGIAYSRALYPVEASGANRAVFVVLALAGVSLLAADGITSRARLEVLLRRVVYAGGFLALVGILQYFEVYDLAASLKVPGLSLNAEIDAISVRSVNRVASMTKHAIEFGVVLAMLFPLAVHRALHLPRGWQRDLTWTCVALMGTAIPLAVSRSAVLGLVVGMVVFAAVWDWRRRIQAMIVAVISVAVLRVVIPGVLGTLRALFENADVDPSLQGRAEARAEVAPLIADRPFFGRGTGTYLPEVYGYLDNQYLGTLVESGIVGLLAVLGVLVVGVALAGRVRRRAADPETRSLGQALVAAYAVAAVTFATFDALAFPTNAGLLFLLLGCGGALWRLALHEGSSSPPEAPETPLRTVAAGSS